MVEALKYPLDFQYIGSRNEQLSYSIPSMVPGSASLVASSTDMGLRLSSGRSEKVEGGSELEGDTVVSLEGRLASRFLMLFWLKNPGQCCEPCSVEAGGSNEDPLTFGNAAEGCSWYSLGTLRELRDVMTAGDRSWPNQR